MPLSFPLGFYTVIHRILAHLLLVGVGFNLSGYDAGCARFSACLLCTDTVYGWAHDRVVPRQNAEAITWGSKTQAVIITGSHLAMYTKPTAAATAISGVCGTTIESPGVSLFASFPSYEGVCDVNGSRRG